MKRLSVDEGAHEFGIAISDGVGHIYAEIDYTESTMRNIEREAAGSLGAEPSRWEWHTDWMTEDCYTLDELLRSNAKPSKSYWRGSPYVRCDICRTPSTGMVGEAFYDFSVPSARGRWGRGCKDCFASEGGRLGVGRGQRYQRAADGRFEKTGG